LVHFKVTVLAAGEVDRRRAMDTRADFLMPAAAGVSTERPLARGLGFSRKPEASG
jgi:hypothetical protein